MTPFRSLRPLLSLVLAFAGLTAGAAPTLPGIADAVRAQIAQKEIAGAVTVVMTKDEILHLESYGHAELAAPRPMAPDSVFWIASMSKPITAVAVLMLQDEGRLNVTDRVAKFVPAFADLKTPSGQPANLTIAQILTHTSGLGEAPLAATLRARTLEDLVPVWLGARMNFEPGERWQYSQSGINLAARIVEIVSGMTFDVFLRQRLFEPLGMKDTTFYPNAAQKARLAVAYDKDPKTGALTPSPERPEYNGATTLPPQGNGGLYSTANDYLRFCQMLLGRGSFAGRRILSEESFALLTTVQTGDLPTGFFQSEAQGSLGRNYGWGIGTCILRVPHGGPTTGLSAGTFGHGGVRGTQAWIDPVTGVAYLLMVQRGNFGNSDNSSARRAFQQAAAAALAHRRQASITPPPSLQAAPSE